MTQISILAALVLAAVCGWAVRSFWARRLDRLSARAADLERQVKETRAGAQAADERVQAVLGSMFEGVVVIEPDGRVLFMNGVFARIFETDPASRGRHYWEIFRQEKLNELIRRGLSEGMPQRGDVALFVPEERHFQVQLSPIRAPGGAHGAVLVLHDVTSLKRLERVRSEFVSNVSHELRTPLASIIGAVETLKNGAVDDRENRGDFLNMIEEHSRGLKELIEELLDLSSLESGASQAAKTDVSVDGLFEELKKTFEKNAREKKIDLRFEQDPRLQAVPGGRPRLRQAISNLIENAIKFTDPGGSVSVRAGQDDGQAVFTVSDNGIGIAPEDQRRVFERFYRTEKSRSRDAGGRGLGLSIVKHIAESQGGDVTVESGPQRGSVFRLRLPL